MRLEATPAAASYSLVSTPVGTLYEVNGELYPDNTSIPAYLYSTYSATAVTCDSYNCRADFQVDHTGLYHQSRQVLEYRVYSTANNADVARHAGLVFDQSELLPGWSYALGNKRFENEHQVTGLPKCGVRSTGSAQHSAWWGMKVSLSSGAVTVSSVGTFGLVTAASTITPKQSTACPPSEDLGCDDVMTEEVETECASGSSGPSVLGGTGTTEAPGEENGGSTDSVWRCDVTFWYHSDDNGATWYYTGSYDVVGNCRLEPR